MSSDRKIGCCYMTLGQSDIRRPWRPDWGQLGSDEWVSCCGSYDEKMAAETLLTKMNLKNYQVRTFMHRVWWSYADVSMGVGFGGLSMCNELSVWGKFWRNCDVQGMDCGLGGFSWVKRRCFCGLGKWLSWMPRERRC